MVLNRNPWKTYLLVKYQTFNVNTPRIKNFEKTGDPSIKQKSLKKNIRIVIKNSVVEYRMLYTKLIVY